jgi:hypothetical protein
MNCRERRPHPLTRRAGQIPHRNAGVEDGELPPTNTSGRQANCGMEGLAISPDGSKLYGIKQSPPFRTARSTLPNKRAGTNVRISRSIPATV